MGIFHYINPVNWFRAEQRFDTSAEFESAVNHALTADTIADATRKPYISEEGALNLSAVWACVRILSDTVGTLPIHLYKRTDKGRERQYTHPCHRLLQLPNSFSNRFDLMHHLMTSCALWGNGYARIFRDNKHRPVRLQLLHPARVEPVLTTTDELFYKLDTGELIANDDIIHLRGLSTNGIKGKSPIAVHRDNLSLTMAAQLYGEKFFNQGGNMSGVFKYPSTLKPEAYQRLKKDLMAQSVGLHNAHIPLLLEGGMTYERISIPPEDAQFIATRKFQKTEIATIYGVPPHMIADLERATNNNIEHQGMEFVTYCLMPYLVRLEEEFNRKLLRNDEFEEYYFLFGLNGLLRGDAKTRSEYYKNLNLIGAMNANEIRALEDMNAYEGGDNYFVQLNMTTVNNAINGNQQNTISQGDRGEVRLLSAPNREPLIRELKSDNRWLRRKIRQLERTNSGVVQRENRSLGIRGVRSDGRDNVLQPQCGRHSRSNYQWHTDPFDR